MVLAAFCSFYDTDLWWLCKWLGHCGSRRKSDITNKKNSRFKKGYHAITDFLLAPTSTHETSCQRLLKNPEAFLFKRCRWDQIVTWKGSSPRNLDPPWSCCFCTAHLKEDCKHYVVVKLFLLSLSFFFLFFFFGWSLFLLFIADTRRLWCLLRFVCVLTSRKNYKTNCF